MQATAAMCSSYRDAQTLIPALITSNARPYLPGIRTTSVCSAYVVGAKLGIMVATLGGVNIGNL